MEHQGLYRCFVKSIALIFVPFFLFTIDSTPSRAADEPIKLRCMLVPSVVDFGPVAEAQRRIVDAFRKQHPNVQPVSIGGLMINQSTGSDMLPLMQIAGGIAPDEMYVNFRQSDTYIALKLLYPLDHYIEQVAGATIPDGSILTNDQYVAALSKAPRWDTIARRVPDQCWAVMRRDCPYGDACPYRAQDGLPPAAHHRHIWAFPVGPLVIGLKYDRAMFAEHERDGVEMHAPRDWNELLEWSKILTDPEANEYGLKIQLEVPSWQFLSFLYSAGGEVVKQDADGQWRCVIASEPAAQAAYFFARLHLEKITRRGKTFRGVMTATATRSTDPARFGMEFSYLDQRFLDAGEAANYNFGPVPAGPTGLRRSEFNAAMCGIFSGLAKETERRDAAWNFLYFYDSDAARKIRTETMVEAGLGQFMRPFLLKQFNVDGRYDDVLRQVSPELEETYRIAYAGGVPEPYGRNCKYVYQELDKPIGEIWQNAEVRAAVDANDPERGLRAIRPILARAQEQINLKMLGNLPPAVEQTRRKTAWAVIALVITIFVLMFRRVLRTFRPPAIAIAPRLIPTASSIAAAQDAPDASTVAIPESRASLAQPTMLATPIEEHCDAIESTDCHSERYSAKNLAGRSGPDSSRITAQNDKPRRSASWQARRYRFAYLLMAPALLTIALWAYWPLARGTLIAFQNYSVLGDSTWVGSGNFADILYDPEFWHSIRASILYALMFIVFGFWTPIALALLLSEIPRGRTLFRTLYYLPAVLSGIVVIFLWRSFYAPQGMINQLLNVPVGILNSWFGAHIEMFNSNWLDNPHAALFCCLLPIIWAGMGPGSLIYLAAFKTVPDEIYEAADIDGAGIRHKIFSVALPSIKSLVLINFIGAIIGAVRGAAGFILAMTGGGPFTTSGGATEVTALKIFYETFGYLRFGPGAAMAWVLGAMLIGFTVLQLQRLSKLEFRTATKT